jgi:hypothetical protein
LRIGPWPEEEEEEAGGGGIPAPRLTGGEGNQGEELEDNEGYP